MPTARRALATAAISSGGGTACAKPDRDAEARAGRQHDAAARQAAIDEALREGLDEADFRSEIFAATEPSRPITAPRCGSSTSSRESRSTPPKNFDSLTCGNRRSISS